MSEYNTAIIWKHVESPKRREIPLCIIQNYVDSEDNRRLVGKFSRKYKPGRQEQIYVGFTNASDEYLAMEHLAKADRIHWVTLVEEMK